MMSRWLVPRWALAMAVVLLVGLGGCGEAPVVRESLCRGLPGSWFSDVSGETALTDRSTGDHLPLGGPDKNAYLDCSVFDDDKVVVWLEAEVTPDPSEIHSLQRSLERSPDQWDFEIGGGRGGISGQSKRGLDAAWTCGRTTVRIEVRKFADKGKKMDLTKQLAERIAGATGCVN